MKLQRLIVALACGLAGCSSFEDQWRAAGPVRSDFSGRWQGRWTSAKHRNSGGAIRCILTPAAAADADGSRLFNAYFKARWLTFSATYQVPLKGRERAGALYFAGEHKLPAVYGGVYRFDGKATRQHFSASYDSSYDHGRFEMERVF